MNTTAAVVGAGLAGAALVRSLCRAGQQVTWLDSAEQPAAGASALPVGMLSPHVTAQPTPLSALTQLGVSHTRAELQRLLPQGHGWWATEVDNHGHDAGRHPACLVRPAALIEAWHAEALASGQLHCRWSAHVASLARQGDCWRLLSAEGALLAEAHQVFIAAAWGSLPLLTRPLGLTAQQLPLRPVKGQLSLGPLAQPVTSPFESDRPQRQDGVYVPCYSETHPPPGLPARLWAMGSTYERGADDTTVNDEAHARNLASLERLSPAAAQRMREQASSGQLLGWAGVRCASLDRLPLAGALPDAAATTALLGHPPFHRRKPQLAEVPRLPGLFSLAALGSRGLTLASLCAERLVQDALGLTACDPAQPQIDVDLWTALDPARFLWRQLKRQQTHRTS